MGDTCYSWAEDTPVYNPDGKEIIARDNEISEMRKDDLHWRIMGVTQILLSLMRSWGSIRVTG